MALKVDKELLIKHHFWILLGLSVVLILIALIMLPSSVGSTVEQHKKAYDNAKDTLNRISEVKNQKFVNAYMKSDKYVADKRDKVWAEAWELQKDMMTWPYEFKHWVKKYPYFGDRIEDLDRELYPRHVREQPEEVIKIVQPVDEKGDGAVQFRGYWNDVVLIDLDLSKTPVSSDDIWMFQENLWVKRELLRVIRDANDLVGRFHEVDDKPQAQAPSAKGKAAPAPTASAPNPKRFRNPHWELDLRLVRNNNGQHVLGGTIKNIAKRQQALGISFKVLLQQGEDPASTELKVDGLPMAAGSPPRPLNDLVLDDQKTIQGLFGVEQIFTWRTAPVKRLDRLEVPYFSSRTINREKFVVVPKWIGTPELTSAPALAPPPAGGGAPPPPSDTAAAAQPKTKNGIPADLYTDIQPAVRHIAVGMLIIVEEDHIPEFLAAFASSKLRIQTLQCHWRHTREKLSPKLETLAAAATAGPTDSDLRGIRMGGRPREPGAPGPTPKAMRGLQGGSGGLNRGSSGLPGGGGQNRDLEFLKSSSKTGSKPQAKRTTEADEEDMNLVELAVYGLASVYERYPPKAAGATTQAGLPVVAPPAPALPPDGR